MKLDDILKEWSKDCVIDTTKVSTESAYIPVLHSKYYTILVKEKVVMENFEQEYKELELQRWKFYNKLGTPEEYENYDGNFFDLTLLKPEKERFMECDEQLVNYKKKLAVQKIKIDTLLDILKMINNRTFQISNWIKYEIFKAGEY